MTATYVGPTPFELQDRRLQARVAEAMGVINAATAQLVEAVEEVVEDGIWNVPGIRSAEHWLMWRAGVSPGRAQGLVRMARRKPELPQLMGLFADGGLTEDAMRLIAAKVPAERDARGGDAGTRAVAFPAAAGLVVLARGARGEGRAGTGGRSG